MPFYTDHPGYLHYWSLQARYIGPDDRFHDPESLLTQDWVWSVALDALRQFTEWMPPAYLAHRCQLPSANAATFAVLEGLRRSGSPNVSAQRFYEDYSDSPDEDEYEPPVDPDDDGEHEAPWCGCRGCVCECGECGCSVCYPDGAEDCEDSSCEYHHGDCDYECSTCHPDDCECPCRDDDDYDDCDRGDNTYDDQNDDDDL